MLSTTAMHGRTGPGGSFARSRLLLALTGATALSCGAAPEAPPRAAAPPPVASAAPSAPLPTPTAATAAAPPAPRPRARNVPHCPEEMALVVRAQGPYCVDRFEATLERVHPDGKVEALPGNQLVFGLEKEIRAVSARGKKPQGYITGPQAAAACERAGKRLCEIDEWVLACRGPKRTVYPYGDVRKANVCNDRYRKLDHHPVMRLFKQHAPPDTDPILMWHPKWMNDPRLHELSHSVVPTGSMPGCSNDYGVYDMVGNLHEWVADPDGTFFGGYLMDTYQNGEGCDYRTIFHPYDYHDYSIGFRCCRDAEWVAAGAEDRSPPSDVARP